MRTFTYIVSCLLILVLASCGEEDAGTSSSGYGRTSAASNAGSDFQDFASKVHSHLESEIGAGIGSRVIDVADGFEARLQVSDDSASTKIGTMTFDALVSGLHDDDYTQTLVFRQSGKTWNLTNAYATYTRRSDPTAGLNNEKYIDEEGIRAAVRKAGGS